MATFQPVEDHVVIEPLNNEEKTESGIVLPDTAEKERPEQGKVVAVGPGKRSLDGTLIPLQVKVGDVVIFSKYGPSEVKVDDKKYLIARQDDILSILS